MPKFHPTPAFVTACCERWRRSARWPQLLFAFVAVSATHAPPAYAVGDGATRINMYVPANNYNSSRTSLVVVTNPSAQPATVSIIDDSADGDSDDTVTNVVLTQGQSRIVRIQEGAVNDEVGAKADGDYFRIVADHPVNVMQATTSNWQHDWAPSEGAGGLGNSFFVYGPPTSGADSDINVFAYHDATEVAIWDITATPTTTSGSTSVNLAGRTLVARVTLNQGEVLYIEKTGSGLILSILVEPIGLRQPSR